MQPQTFTWDIWPVKLGLLAVLLLGHYLCVARWKPRHKLLAALRDTGRETLGQAALVLAVMFLLVNPFIAQAYYIPTGSMEKTLPTNDRILVSKLAYRLHAPRFRDVVVFEAPPAALDVSGQPPGTFFVKRCIGTPGDVVEIRNRVLWRNGKPVAEPYTLWNDRPGNPGYSYDMKIVGDAVYSREYDLSGRPGLWEREHIAEPLADQQAITAAPAGKVPRDRFLMLGDHRTNSEDGHVWGFVPRENVVGKSFAVYWPLRDAGTVDRKSQ